MSNGAAAAHGARDFSLVFRTLSVPQMTGRLERAGFRVDGVLGDYQRAAPGIARADVWMILAEKRGGPEVRWLRPV